MTSKTSGMVGDRNSSEPSLNFLTIPAPFFSKGGNFMITGSSKMVGYRCKDCGNMVRTLMELKKEKDPVYSCPKCEGHKFEKIETGVITK